MILELLFGPRCKVCNKLEAYIRVCDDCFHNKFKEIRNRYRYYSGTTKYCRVCGQNIGKKYYHSFCYKCVPMHPDDTHMNNSNFDPEDGWWSKAIRQGGWDVGDQIVKTINCLNCGGLLVLTVDSCENCFTQNDPEYVVDYKYYKKGHRSSYPEPFYCDNLPKEILKVEQEKCSHEFIVILEPTTKSYEEYHSHLIDNDAIKDLVDWNKDMINQMAYDMSITKNIVKWCWKCGLEKVFKEKLG